jgi:hypothetical protein
VSDRRLSLVAAAVWVALWVSPLRRTLESDMAVQMAVQLPLLIVVGLVLAPTFRRYEPRALAQADWLGIPGLVLVVFATSFWMLPRTLDLALSNPLTDLVKFLSLPLLGGLPLGLSWRRMPGLGRAFIWLNFIPKLGAIGGLYLAAPTRLCAYYRLDQQMTAGWTLIGLATALGILTFLVAFAGWPAAVCPRRREATDTAASRMVRRESRRHRCA